ncbi:MAG: alpha/beta hydrolase [Ilumatobacter sp.]|uniref:alpha/beta hydrolase n=1 Tax=Ilumatobacter sp. TaxID=1967498 RepID=UPI003C78163E
MRRTKRLRYGPERCQFGVLYESRSSHAVDCVIVLVHGGFWRWPFNRWVTSLLARDAARRGYTVFNIEYRCLGRFGGGGGWPQTFDDVADALMFVSDRFEGARLVLAGHSAGGHLALVTAARFGERVDGVVSICAPTDLRVLSENGSEPVDALVAGTPLQDRWSLTSPIEMVPTGVPTVCVHGDADTTIRPDMSIRYVEAAVDAGDDAELVLVAGEGHRAALLPRSKTWQSALACVDAWRADCGSVSRSTRRMTMDGE